MYHFTYMLICCLLLMDKVVQAQLSVRLLPELLFSISSPARIVEGSVVWLYCEVNSVSSSLSVTWNKNGGAVVQDVPHIILRTSTSSSTTILLALDNVVSSDAGQYQCTAQDGQDTANGTTLTITVQATMTGVLEIVSSSASPMFTVNRTAVNDGDNVSLSYTASYIGGSSSFTAPSAVWLKDGAPTRTTPSDMIINGRLTSTLSFTFQASDAGVYLCIFTGSNTSEIYSTNPLRLDTGNFTVPKRVSPPVIFLTPPEKLVVEYRTSGGYSSVVWHQNQNALGGSSSAPAALSEFTFFAEIFVREITTSVDLGIYDLSYAGEGGIGTFILVTSPVPPTTTVSTGQTLFQTVMEGNCLNISCNSTGGPVPTITWRLNDQPAPFRQTDLITNPVGTMTTGYVISILQIVNAQYPTHDGIYTCCGNNSVVNSNNVAITVQVQAIPEVHLKANQTRVGPGHNVNLNCTVIRGNPMMYTFKWTFNGNSISGFTSSQSSSIYVINNATIKEIGTYSCIVNNEVGRDFTTINISLGEAPILRSNQEQNEVIIVETGNNLSIAVNVTSFNYSQTIIAWAYNNDIIIDYQDRIVLTLVPSTEQLPVISILQRSALVPRHSGLYTITATNPYGRNTISFDVTVTALADIIEPISNMSITTDIGSSVTLVCIARGVPAPNITWSPSTGNYNIFNISADSDGFIYTSSLLTISKIQGENTSVYSCITTNPGGTDSRNFIITIISDVSSTIDPDTRAPSSTAEDSVLSLSQVGGLISGIVGGFIALFTILVIVLATVYLVCKHKLKRKRKLILDVATPRGTKPKENDDYECMDSKLYTTEPKQLQNTLQCSSNPSYNVVCRSNTSQVEGLSADDDGPSYDTVTFETM